MDQTKFLLDSADITEFREISSLLKKSGYELWGATTNPTLVAKLASPNNKITQKEAFDFQKKLVLEILDIAVGSVSAEVYADQSTTAEEMVKQGLEISQWHKRVSVKVPTTFEGFKARTELRKKGISVNNTLVFSQQQIFAICLHEKIIQELYQPNGTFPPFISPFVGRLDDTNQDGMMLVENGMKIKENFNYEVWMLEASVRKPEHIERGIISEVELITAPAKAYKEWLLEPKDQLIDVMDYAQNLEIVPYWNPSKELMEIDSIEGFESAIQSGQLVITHPLTEKGIIRFAQDWHAILKE